MELIAKILLGLHISAGSVSLILFWIPAFAKKGGKLHNQVGRIYYFTMLFVVLTAFLLSMYDIFLANKLVMGLALLFLSFLTLSPLWSGVDAIQQKKQLSQRSKHIRLVLELILLIYGIVLLAIGLYYNVILIMIFGITGILVGQQNVRIFAKKEPAYNWFDTHMSGMIISGSAAYTAFFAFGARSLFGFLQGTPWIVLPWVMPTIIALVVVNVLRKKYKIRPKKAKAITP